MHEPDTHAVDIDEAELYGQLYTCPNCQTVATILYGDGICGSCHYDVTDDHPTRTGQNRPDDRTPIDADD